MKIDKELLEKAGKLSIDRSLEASNQETEAEILALDNSREFGKVRALALIEMLKGTPAHIILGTVYQFGFTTGKAYRELEVEEKNKLWNAGPKPDTLQTAIDAEPDVAATEARNYR